MPDPKAKEPSKPCTATASIFSGRRDPTWEVPQAVTRRLRELWDAAEPVSTGSPSAPGLGYRGVTLSCAGGEQWFAYAGTLRFGKEYRRDQNRTFERTLLLSAPKGMLPPAVIDQLR